MKPQVARFRGPRLHQRERFIKVQCRRLAPGAHRYFRFPLVSGPTDRVQLSKTADNEATECRTLGPSPAQPSL